jgi:ferritin-like metal-binding protein YciE
MSAPQSLTDCYVEELAYLWPPHDQMEPIVRELAEAADDEELASRLRASADGIKEHTQVLKSLLEDMGESSKEHCKGMEGLVAEARKHALDADIEDPEIRDVVIVAQYQRMCHYGICGFGTATAFAEALALDDHVEQLEAITGAIYDADENLSDLAERSINLQARETEEDEDEEEEA